MTEEDLLRYCFYYKGEAMMPQSFDNDSNLIELWTAEKFVCKEMTHMIDEKNPRKSVANWVAAYVSKWDPWEFRDVLDVYLEKVPDQKEFIYKVYYS